MPADEPSTSPQEQVPWYRLEVRGRLPAALVDELDGFTIRPGLTTTLTGPVVDASALYGLVARLESIGVALLSIRRTAPLSLAHGEPD